MSSSPMISVEMMFVRKLGEYYGAMAYALYPSQSMQEDLHGLELQSYVSNLAEWLGKGILLSQSLSKTLISAEPLLSPKIRYGTGRRGWKYSLPARILDDYMVCRARAYYTAHAEEFRPRRILDMEESEKRGNIFVKMYLIPALERVSSEEGILNKLVKVENCNEENRVYYIAYEDIDKEIDCKPDMLAITLLNSRVFRVIVFEVADTDTSTILKTRHVLPRIILYMMAIYLYYGIPSIGVYVSLSPKSYPPALLLKPRKKAVNKLLVFLEEIKRILELEEPPKPSSKPPCGHCVYASICRFAK